MSDEQHPDPARGIRGALAVAVGPPGDAEPKPDPGAAFPYTPCDEPGCQGAAVAGDTCLLHHASSLLPTDFYEGISRLLQELNEREQPIDLRAISAGDETVFENQSTAAVVNAILQAIPSTPGEARTCKGLLLDGATIDGVVIASAGGDPSSRLVVDGPLLARGAEFVDVSMAGVDVRGDTNLAGLEATNLIASDCRFGGEADLSQASFSGPTDLSRTTFVGRMSFSQSWFRGRALFRDCTWERPEVANFVAVQFGGPVDFWSARFEAGFQFAMSRFEDSASFVGFRANGPGRLDDTWFLGIADLSSASCMSGLEIVDCQFAGPLDLWKMHANKHFVLRRSRFRDLVRCEGIKAYHGLNVSESAFEGPLSLAGGIIRGPTTALDGTFFAAPVQMRSESAHVTARRATFASGINLYSKAETIDLEEAAFGADSLVTGTQSSTSPVTGDAGAGRIRPAPMVLSLRGADVSGLTLDSLSLRLCPLEASRNLARLRLGPSVEFDRSPRRRSQRQVILDELVWRQSRQANAWSRERDLPTELSMVSARHHAGRRSEEEPRKPPEPSAVAPLYRALRAGREAEGNAPGAGDFYYGEMEMRRHDRTSSPFERAILHAYWAVSGYGLRPGRAFGLLFALMAASVLILQLLSIDGQEPGIGETSLYVARSVVSLTRDPEPPAELQLAGEWLQLGLRFLGPAIIALGILALRSRVRR